MSVNNTKKGERCVSNNSVTGVSGDKSSKAQFTRCALAHVHNTCVVKTAHLHDVLCTYVFAEFASVFPPSLIYTRILTTNEFEILALILLIIIAGANILFCI